MKDETIKSISYSNADTIKSILKLHVPNHEIECDVTYSKGAFYKNTGIKEPAMKFDIAPQTEDTIQADCRKLPLEDGSVECIMFDPPFIVSKGPSLVKGKCKDGSNIISNRFACFESPSQLYSFYDEAMAEFKRVLKENGVLIFKCQDTVSGGVNYMSHCYVHNMALKHGFYPKDLFVLNAKSRLISGKVKRQLHARKYHCYFWVFTKDASKIDRIGRATAM